MKVIGLDGKVYSFQLVHSNNLERNSSSYHVVARELIKHIFPSDRIWEEVSLPGTRPTLFADFLIPFRKLLIEVHGEQHYKWIPHFHSTRREFLQSKQLDSNKKFWCNLNGFLYIELPYSENIDEWRRRIITFGETG